jgi:hypothetical protein
VSAAPVSAVHLDLDGAWVDLPLPRVDAARWGPPLRFSTPPRILERFERDFVPRLGTFVVYGSGDFHHLSAVLLRRLREPFTLVAFDNHPDWDLRPPRWSCGGWINRALELPFLRQAAVWGCGNFECWWPHQIFGNRRAERSGRLRVHPWADERPPRDRQRRGAILRTNWRECFEEFARQLQGEKVYVTIDLDCLAPGLAWTNWENGEFTCEDVGWALETLRRTCRVNGGDMCGAYSVPTYARAKQRFAAEWDHPKLALPSVQTMQSANRAAFDALWPALAQ